ncbi:hypothetical protein HYY73_02280 [Candidatus Woesearchaeota archaeon]|nr:hypothetical protein [Candidatus Woesearchaeota archaeon]
MRFRNDDFPIKKKGNELTDTIAEEHPKHLAAVAEEQIKAMHHHNDGSRVELHEVGSREFIQESIRSSLEGKLGSGFANDSNFGEKEQNASNLNAAKIEYERKSSQNQPGQLYGSQQSVTGAGAATGHETVMMGCNCGAEWTVTGQSTKANDSNTAAGVKIEQYGSASGGAAGYRASGPGGETAEYKTGAGQQQDYKG